MSSTFWDERYGGDDLAYGEAPNEFLAAMADRLPQKGSALDIGAGEGRNALFLASPPRELDVLAVDQSAVGMQKAERLAREHGLKLRTQAADLRHFDAAPASLDAVSSIFVHLPPALRALVHKRIGAWLRVGGVFILEAYGPDQLARATGGPKDASMLPSLETILLELDGTGLEVEHRAALVRDVREGRFHTGEASVVQLVARKR